MKFANSAWLTVLSITMPGKSHLPVIRLPRRDPDLKADDSVQRTVLPIPDQPYIGLTTYDAKNPETKYPLIRELRPPGGAPNVLIIRELMRNPGVTKLALLLHALGRSP